MVDFALLKQRLRQSVEKLSGTLDSVESQRLLEERGRQIAQRQLVDEATELWGEVIVVRRAHIKLGLPIESTLEVRQLKVARIPHSSRYVEGIVLVRGNVHCLVDALAFFHHTEALKHDQETLAIFVHGAPGVIGLRIDEVLGPRTIRVAELVAEEHEKKVDFAIAVTHDLVQIIDTKKFLSSQDLIMNRSLM